MTGMTSALPQQMPYMGQPPQPAGQQPMLQPHQGYPQQQQGAPVQPQPVMAAGPVQQQQQLPQPDAPSESLIVFD